ncbi:ethylene-forming-enzyme-like dioxygenase, partial [Genlisea aurea]
INHGIEEGLLQQLRQLSKQFFHLPLPEKQRYARQAGDLQGYGNDMVLFDDQTLDWTDRLYLFVNPQDQKKLHLWPQNPPSFRHTIEEYTHHALTLLNRLLKSMARTLNLPDGTFLKQFGDAPSCHLRFNYYPPCPRPDMVNGVKPHADGSGMTFVLLDDEVEGLQVLKDGAWFRIPAIRGALLVNLGDQLEIMSNGHLKSPVHRVVTNSNSERLTIAMFCSPGTGQEIGPDDRLIDEENPKLYKNTNDYVGIYFQYYQKGLRPIDAVRV